jgi:glucose/arabinose dehydrogenase
MTMRQLVVCALVWLGPATGRADTLLDSALELTEVATVSGGVSDFRFLPDGRVVAVSRTGAVRLVRPGPPVEVTTAHTFSVDATGENGLLAVEVDPAFATTRRLFFFLSKSNASGATSANRNVVASMVLTSGDLLDPASYRELVTGIEGPGNPGGALAIGGGDGTTPPRLFVGTGGSGCVPDDEPATPQNFYATCLSKPNGKILRVELDGTIPADNPLVTLASVDPCGTQCNQMPGGSPVPPRDEIWAWGFRNPTGLAFDPLTQRLWMVDSSEGLLLEEINEVSRRRHYGWPWRIGDAARSYSEDQCAVSTPVIGEANCERPDYFCVAAPSQTGLDGDCEAAVGGAFLDTCAFAVGYRASFYFADRTSGALYQLRLNPARDNFAADPRTQLATITGNPTAVRLGPDGNLFVSTATGRLVRVSPVAESSCDADAGTGNGGGGGAGPTPFPSVPGGDPLPSGRCGCQSGPEGAGLAGLSLLLGWALLRRSLFA